MSDSRVMNLRFPGACATCGAALDRVRVPIGTHKSGVYIARHIVRWPRSCTGLEESTVSTGGPSVKEPPVEVGALERGVAGRSAQREHDHNRGSGTPRP